LLTQQALQAPVNGSVRADVNAFFAPKFAAIRRHPPQSAAGNEVEEKEMLKLQNSEKAH